MRRRGATVVRFALAVALLAAGALRADGLAPVNVPLGDVRLAAHPAAREFGNPSDPIAVRLRGAMNQGAKFALNTWWDEYMTGVDPYLEAHERARTNDTIDSEEVRRYTSVAYGLAAALATGAYDPEVTGVDTVTATLRVAEIVRYVASTHRANMASKLGWGGSVQASLWAAQVTTAGWLIGPALSPAAQVMIGRLLAWEADAVSSREPLWFRDRELNVLRPGNSGAEEQAWDAVALYTAVELLPHHASRARWAEAAYRRFVGAYSRPQDVRSERFVNGRRVTDWLDGSNAEANGFVINHGKVNPDYTTDIALWAAPVAGLVGARMPEAVLEGVDVTYRALTTVRFSSPPNPAPGGTVYRPGTATIYYPRGSDWGTRREFVYGALDAQTAVLSPDPRIRATARGWAVSHLDSVRRLQSRFKTGQMFGSVSEDKYQSREEHALMLLGNAYLTWWLQSNAPFTLDQRPASAKVAVP